MRDLANRSYSPNNSSKPKINFVILRLVIVVAVVAAAVYFIGGRLFNLTSSNVPGGVVLREAPRGLEPVEVDGSMAVVGEGVDLASDTASFTLVRNGFTGQVKATRSYGDDTFNLNVDAQLEDPEGHKYGVWLVSGNDRVIAGHMSGTSDFRLRLRENDRELLAYDEIWITLERAEDDEPEDHIFEGSF